MADVKNAYGTYAALTVTNLQSLANDSTDPFGAWQSARVSNLSTLALDYEVFVDLTTAASAPANDAQAYVYVIPWVTTDGGTTWIPGGNLGTTTQPTGSEGAASVSDPNSMVMAFAIPYKVASQRLQCAFGIEAVLGFCPDAWSLAIRNCTGAALSTGCVVSYRSIHKTVA
jgi:hypothetical protein